MHLVIVTLSLVMLVLEYVALQLLLVNIIILVFYLFFLVPELVLADVTFATSPSLFQANSNWVLASNTK
jgi:hypothetical protein